MRLTNRFSVMGRKYDLAYGQANTWKRKLKNNKYELIENAIDKLGQLEDIEDKLGIDLITVSNGWKNGIYILPCGMADPYDEYVDDEENPREYHLPAIKARINTININDGSFTSLRWKYYFRDIGKTWAVNERDLVSEEYRELYDRIQKRKESEDGRKIDD